MLEHYTMVEYLKKRMATKDGSVKHYYVKVTTQGSTRISKEEYLKKSRKSGGLLQNIGYYTIQDDIVTHDRNEPNGRKVRFSIRVHGQREPLATVDTLREAEMYVAAYIKDDEEKKIDRSLHRFRNL